MTFLNFIGTDSCEASLSNMTTGQLNVHQILSRPRTSIDLTLDSNSRPDIYYQRASLEHPQAINQRPFSICWICAGEAALYFFSRTRVESKPARFSVQYYYFFHLLEQVNFHLKALAEIALERENLTPKHLAIEHGGSFQELLYLMTRYGFVPTENFGVSINRFGPIEIENYLRHLLAAAFLRFKEVVNQAKKENLNVSKKIFEEKEVWLQNAILTLEVFFGKLPLQENVVKASESQVLRPFVSSGSWTGFYVSFRETTSTADFIQGLPKGIIAHEAARDLSLYYYKRKKISFVLEKIDQSLEQNLPVVVSIRMRPGADLQTGHLHASVFEQSALRFGWKNIPQAEFSLGYLGHFETTEYTHSIVLFDRGLDATGKKFYHAMNSWGDLGDRGRLHIEEDYLKQYLIEAFIRTEIVD